MVVVDDVEDGVGVRDRVGVLVHPRPVLDVLQDAARLRQERAVVGEVLGFVPIRIGLIVLSFEPHLILALGRTAVAVQRGVVVLVEGLLFLCVVPRIRTLPFVVVVRVAARRVLRIEFIVELLAVLREDHRRALAVKQRSVGGISFFEFRCQSELVLGEVACLQLLL